METNRAQGWRTWPALLVLAGPGLALGCGGGGSPVGPPPPTTGTVTVRVTTSGQTLDTNGYSIALDAAGPRTAGTNDSVVFTVVTPGPHVIRVAGLAVNCSVAGGDSIAVTVTAGVALRVPVAIACTRAFRNEILFTSRRDGNAEIYVMTASGGMQARVTNNPAGDTDPAISADGMRFAFISDRSGNWRIWVMAADGGGGGMVSGGPLSDICPSWSPDGARIAFLDNGEMWVVNSDGTSQERIVSDSTVTGYGCPAWSPDGARIAFGGTRNGASGVYSMRPDGSDPVAVDTGGGSNGDLAWSWDGRKLAFVSDRAGNPEIYTVNADGSGLLRLTTNAAFDFHPTWSPDGTRIAFQSNRALYTKADIWVMQSDGSSPAQLTTATGDNTNPVWSRGP